LSSDRALTSLQKKELNFREFYAKENEAWEPMDGISRHTTQIKLFKQIKIIDILLPFVS
jgi:hypothetical protein